LSVSSFSAHRPEQKATLKRVAPDRIAYPNASVRIPVAKIRICGTVGSL